MNRRTFLAAAALLLAGCGSTSATSVGASAAAPAPGVDPALAARLQGALDGARRQAGYPGAVAGVWTPQGMWLGLTGTRGPGSADAPDRLDHGRAGSITKTMTATILLQLYEEGRLSLDDVIGKYVPGVPNGDTATLSQLASMTSGIPSYTFSSAFQARLFGNPTAPFTPDELIGYIRGTAPDFPPGQGFFYSNTNYVLLGMVIEQVTGQGIGSAFQQRIFERTGMSRSIWPGISTDIPDPHLSGITAQGQPDGQTADATHWNPSSAFAAGEVITTLDDLFRWSEAFFTGNAILRPETQLLRRQSIRYGVPPFNNPRIGYGLGISDEEGWWGHDGSIPGYNTVLSHNYDLDTTILALINSDVFVPGTSTDPGPFTFNALRAALDG